MYTVSYRQPSGGGPVLIACDSPVSGRYVVIQARNSQTLTLCEVDVYGKLEPFTRITQQVSVCKVDVCGKLETLY